MPSSYTPSLRLVLPVTGELTGTWGDTVNNGLTQLVEAAIAGTAAVTMTDANYTLTTANEAADEARCMFIALSGGSLTATRDVICPSVSKLYFVLNGTTGGQSIRFKTSAGTGVTIPNGHRALLYCDGTNVTPASGLPPMSSTGSNGSALSSLGALGADTQARTGASSVAEADRGDVLFCTNSFTLSLTAAATLGDGFSFGVVNAGTGSIIIDPAGSETIDGAATLTLTAGQSCLVVTDGSNWRSIGRGIQTQAQLPINQPRTDVASASSVDLTTLASSTDHINITGATTITGFTVASGRLLFVRFNASLTLTNNANIVTQSGANIVTQAGDTCLLRATAANTVEVLSYVCYGGPAGQAKAWVNFNGTGTVAIRASFNVSSITDNGTGDYTVNFTSAFSDANYVPAGLGSAVGTDGRRLAEAGAVRTTTAFRVNTENSSGANTDSTYVSLAFFR